LLSNSKQDHEIILPIASALTGLFRDQ